MRVPTQWLYAAAVPNIRNVLVPTNSNLFTFTRTNVLTKMKYFDMWIPTPCRVRAGADYM